MNFNKHFQLKGEHSYLSPSNYHWINYDEEKFRSVYINVLARERGTKLHDLAQKCIEMGVYLPDIPITLNMYVNDSIKYHLQPEQVLYFSEYCFGTADSIGFDNGLLRIHDLKTGEVKASMNQLMIYASLFCLEYDIFPNDISMELRIYQLNEIYKEIPDQSDILYIMDKIVMFDRIIRSIREESEDLY